MGKLEKHQEQAYKYTSNTLEDLESRLKLMENEENKLNEAERGSPPEKNRVWPPSGAGYLEASVLENYSHIYQSPIFEHTVESSELLEENTSREIFFLLNKSSQRHRSFHKTLTAQEHGKNVELAKLNSEIEILKRQVHCTPQVQSHKKKKDELKQELSRNKTKAVSLEIIVAEKESQMQELKRHIQYLQNEKDNITLLNINLMFKVQEANKESRQHSCYVADFLAINEELLALAQRKEEEVNSLSKQLESLQKVVSEKSDDNIKLTKALEGVRKEMADLRQHHLILKQHYALTQLKLASTEMDLTKSEASLEKVTQHLSGIVENQDSLFADSEYLNRQLKDTKYKEFQIETELMHSRKVMNDLKENICHMEDEMCKLKAEMREIINQNHVLKRIADAKEWDLLTLQNEIAKLWEKVQYLEEEVMEKEGQIAILKGSFLE